VRAVLISQIAPGLQAMNALLRANGHEPVALLTVRQSGERYGEFTDLLHAVPDDLDVVMPASRDRIAPLLRVFEPDVAFCIGFPWKIPAEAIAVPRLGIVNGHPSLLPRHRGPSPVAWAIRSGEDEIGFTLHYMDPDLDTGNVLAQAPIPLGDEHSWDELTPKLAAAASSLFPWALERLERGDPGDAQTGAGTYESAFEPDYVRIDWSRPGAEIERQVRAWRFHHRLEEHGALAELDGETVRVLRVSRDPGSGHEVPCGDGTLWVVETEPA
jgi:methionyl-tRNA formyltransferase